ncbi:GIY-YIG catalytic domain-containing protein [Algoriphagus antarcticus]|uniref:GIY-YIG catalytic domain-containing protein n=1 Tax=Algoriphagus antarcticus TaxID=238540 RepID=A0A3E0DJ94_9BACT|nr:GIY-YIG nuclease family protein [Algoriphagus antarcticus]REG81873.1 GIY-YIG catalytic domain-containing protein [Algoriphagus antarcticus]
MDFLVYIIYSKSLDKFYIGYSADFEKRISFHNSTQNTIWTKASDPDSSGRVLGSSPREGAKPDTKVSGFF